MAGPFKDTTRMIIIEGADLTGKTTVQKRLVAELRNLALPAMPLHMGPLPKVGVWKASIDYQPYMLPNAVWDRFHLSEVVYRLVDRKRTGMTPRVFQDISRVIAGLGPCATMIVITASESLLSHRFELKDRDELYSLEEIQEANKHYINFVNAKLYMPEDLEHDDMYMWEWSPLLYSAGSLRVVHWDSDICADPYVSGRVISAFAAEYAAARNSTFAS